LRPPLLALGNGSSRDQAAVTKAKLNNVTTMNTHERLLNGAWVGRGGSVYTTLIHKPVQTPR